MYTSRILTTLRLHGGLRLGGIFLASTVLVPGCASSTLVPAAGTVRTSEVARRTFRPFLGERWIGNAICYSPYRDGQRPGARSDHLDEVEKHCGLFRSDRSAKKALAEPK